MSLLVRFRMLLPVGLFKSDNCPVFLHTTWYCNRVKDYGGSDPSDGKSPTHSTKTQLTSNCLEVFRLHKEACEAEKRLYIDPSTGYKVFTAFAHLKRGKCCGSACRHCPYGQVNVCDPTKKKHFNSLYYV